MLYQVPRTCTFTPQDLPPESHEISHFREEYGYVLLGDPGAGKSTLFEKESTESGGYYLSAREFLTFDTCPEWQGETLFIDGLDETRAGVSDARTPLDAIRRKLNQLGCPRFRLSCREADWLGGNDQTALAACAPDGKVIVLHLNALTEADILTILKNDPHVDDAANFLNMAKQFSLQGLLQNPQTLEMLIAAVQGNNWPNSKLETYELACRKMAQEHNDEHKAASKKAAAKIEALLDAAGYLYAVLLLANATAIVESYETKEGQICLNEIQIPDALPCDPAIKTRLFKCESGEYQPTHRSVAEFLGARYLAKKIKEGKLPLSRVLALMTGFDGGVVAALRGLSGWLCAHSPTARNHLIEIDPLGVVLYGDVLLFAKETKQQLLAALRNEAKNGSLRYDFWASYPFAALTTPDMATPLLELLTSPSREKHDQQILSFMLDGLYRSSEPVQELKQALLAIVRDKTYLEDVRVGALLAFMHQHPEDVDSLLSLADDFRAGKIEDIQERLLGYLLTELFPKYIGVRKIFDYFKPAKHDIHSTRIVLSFWDSLFSALVKNRVQDQDVTILLDEMLERGIKLQSQVSGEYSLTGELLVRALSISDETISNEHLYDWLSLGLDEYHHPHLENKHQEFIRAWFENRPERYLALIGVGLNRISDDGNVNVEINKIIDRLYSASPPERLGLWWLERALVADARIATTFFTQAWWLLINGSGCKGLTLEFFERWVEQHPDFSEQHQKLTVCELEEWRAEHTQTRRNWEEKRKAELAKRLTNFREYLPSIRDGSAPPAVMYDLSNKIWEDANTSDNAAGKRLAEFLGQDESLIAAARSGMRKILDRTDLPTPAETFALAAKKRQHYICQPFLICMDGLYRENPAMLDSLSDDLAAKALAYWYTFAGTGGDWVKPLSNSRPALTTKIYIDYVRAMLAAKEEVIHGISQLKQNSEYQEFAKLVVFPLLEIYPVRATVQQASTLKHLLKAAIAIDDRERMLALISEKLALSAKRMDVIQRVYWLIAGMLVFPDLYADKLKRYVVGKVAHINHLSEFLYSVYSSVNSQQSGPPLSPAVAGLIVELLAPRCSPRWPERTNSLVTQTMQEGDYVNFLLKQLGENPDEKCAEVIDHLLSLPQLMAWHETLHSVRQTWQISRREALFRHPNATAVALALNNLKPANAADLAALAMEHLTLLAAEIRSSNTDSYKHLWNEGSYRKPESPKLENSCRNYLAEKLRAVLIPLDVEIQIEKHAANEKRADMCLSCHANGSAFHLPIEIKLDHSPDLWRAIHEQLIPLYTLDPETQGRGIFLVLWFDLENLPEPTDGTKPKRMPPHSGKPPKTPAELQARLIETLTPQEQKLIDVFVMDVSKPNHS